MTLQEAFRVVDQQERLPIDQVDMDLLLQARDIIMRHVVSGGIGRVASGEESQADRYAQRLHALIDRVVDREQRLEAQRKVKSPEELAELGAPLFTQAREQDATLGDRNVMVTDGQIRMSSDFEARLREAAQGAGVDPATVESVIDNARQLSESTGMNPESLLQQQLDQWEREAARNAPTPIGVPQGFVAQPETELAPADRARFGGAQTVTQEIEPRYFEGDELVPASMDPAEILRIQKELERAGLIPPGGYWEGFWDEATASAYKRVLGYANQRGEDAETTIKALVEAAPDPDQLKGMDAFVEPPFLKPDFATLTQEVKALFRTKVGREPTDAELSEWAGHLSESYRAQHEALVAAQRFEFEAGRVEPGSIPEGTDPADRKFFPDSAQPSVGSTQFEGEQVDPIARFVEAFESRYGAEINRLESLPKVRENMANVQRAMSSMGRLIGG